jgi:peptide/nickel transport system substrate-binding protein
VTAPYYADLGTTPYDPAQANALLDRAGWVRGADGIRAKGGVRLELRVASQSGRSDVDAQLALVRADWERIGVGLTIRHYPPALMFAPPQQGGIIYGNTWDVITFAWAADTFGDFSGIYGCKSFPPAGPNNIRWCNKTAQTAMDALLVHYKQSERNADVNALKHYHPNNVTPFDNMMNVDI